MKTFDHCDWAVAFDTPAATQDDRQPKRSIDAWFCDPFLAREYIDKCLPAENRARFYVVHRDQLKGEEIY